MADPAPGDRLYSFPGGLKLRHHKQVACEQPVARPPLPPRLIVPLRQHQGPAGRLLVAAGDPVVRGQPLTAADDDFQVPVHTPASGRVESIEEHPVLHPPGTSGPCCVIRADPDGADLEPRRLHDWEDAHPRAITDHLRAAGLSGLGGAEFPTAAKLRGKFAPVHTLILNGSECEPWIACDEMLMRERADAIVTGGRILARAAGAERIVIAIEDRMGTVHRSFERVLPDQDPDDMVRVVQVTTIYPEGGERQLIQVLTGHEVPFDGLPQDLGVVCLNVATAAAARDAVVDGVPVIERVITVTGPGIKRPCNLLAAIGTPVAHLVAAAGGYQDDVERLVLGGPLSGLPIADDRAPVTKGTNCILALTRADVIRTQPVLPCINCGECVRVCPARLLPQSLYHALRGGDLDSARELNLHDCIECGCCAQVCPSHIPLVDAYRAGKVELRRQGIEEARARRARGRHEARTERLEKETQRRRQRREAREARLSRPDAAREELHAAIDRARERAARPDKDSGNGENES